VLGNVYAARPFAALQVQVAVRVPALLAAV